MTQISENSSKPRRNIFLHVRPRTVPAAVLRFRHTWGLGGAAALMIVVQLATGLLLNFSYDPTPATAWSSVQHINYEVFLGAWFRNLHHWTGHALIVVTALHMLRVFVDSAFRSPRYLNWIIGLGLGALILLANFSGYLLPWDQRAYWAVTIASSILEYLPGFGPALLEFVRGGSEIGPATLHIFHTLHSGILPLLLLSGMTWHFWHIRRAGGLYLSKRSEAAAARLPADPYLFTREKTAAAVVLAGLLYAAIFFNAPLGAQANPALTPNMVRAPWYFIGLQELLIHINPVAVVLILPLTSALFLLFLPLVKAENRKGNRLIRLLFFSLAAGYAVLTLTGIVFRGPGMQLIWPF